MLHAAVDHVRDTVAGPLSRSECYALAEAAAATTATRALEVGHYFGLSTCVLLAALPAECELVTIDHHRGDGWTGPTSFDQFTDTTAQFVHDRSFIAINDDMETALPALDGQFGFVFYDADHTEAAVRTFWRLACPLLEPDCVLLFDDADWKDQSVLRELAEDDGFRVVTGRPFDRRENDKSDPDTYTLEVMAR